MSGISTHVLDLAHGRPSAGMRVRLSGDMILFDGVTNHDGRCPDMLGARALEPGEYRLRFAVADYYRGQGLVLPDPPFLDIVTIAFGIADPAAHHHVPLLVSPFGYSTYRGS